MNEAVLLECSEPKRDADSEKAVRIAAMDLLARREHSRLELNNKLLKRFSDFHIIQRALDKLCEYNLLNEARFAESYINHRQKKGFGPIRIRAELKEKGVGDEHIQRYLHQYAESWTQLAEQAREKKFGAIAPTSSKDIARQQRFLQYRGFAFEQFSSLFNSY